MGDPAELRARAAHYRELAAQITDARTKTGIMELARQYEEQAAEIEARETDPNDDAG